MSEFDDWYKEKGEGHHIYNHERWIAKHGFKAGQQSQQAKIDELQNKLDYHIETNADLAKLVLEQQGRIDLVIAKVDEYYDTDGMSDLVFFDVVNILKGNKDEN